MKLTRAVAYAIQAVTTMSKAGDKIIPSHVIAKACGIPERFLLKVLKPLVANGDLYSLRGPNGGYRLARAPKDITLLGIIETVDAPIRGMADLGNHGKAGVKANGLAAKLQAVCEQTAKATRDVLGKVRIADLVRAASGKGK
jgi:Rrf2 family protein